MLYVFIVSSGMMMKFDMTLAVQKVIELKKEIARRANIPQDEQVLLCSGGEELQSDNIVGNYYGAGTDTNPIFLFSKYANEMDRPYASLLETSVDMSIENDVTGCESMAPNAGAATVRLSLAQRFAEYAVNGKRECDELVHSQHLQQQGWAAVIANLEDAKDTLLKRKIRFEDLFQRYLSNRTSYQETIYLFPRDIELLAKIPLFPKLIIGNNCSEEDLEAKHTLLSWFISEPKDVLETLVEKCHRLLDELNEHTIIALNEEMQQVLKNADNSDIKEVKGIENRLSKLNIKIEEAKELERNQLNMAAWFNQKQSLITTEPHAVEEICKVFQNHLIIMLGYHKELRDILDMCKKAKMELSDSINARLKYISKVESEMYQLHMRVILLESHVQSVMSQVESYRQVQLAPHRYLKLLAEVCRRKVFSASFLKWATELSSQASKLYNKEINLRKSFTGAGSKNMVDNLFPGMNDVPPPFAVECPTTFDQHLPEIVPEDLEWLKLHFPELSHFCEVLPPDPMPYISQAESDSAFSSNVPSSRVASDSVVLSEKIPSVKEDVTTDRLALPSADYSSLPSEYASLPNEVFSLTSSPFEDPLLPTHMEDQQRTKTLLLSVKSGSREQVAGDSDGEEFETLDHYRTSPIATTSLSVHGTKARPNSSSDVIDVNTTQRHSPRVSKARSLGDAASPMQEHLKSPDSLGISADFQAAEYYIDDSMPSSYTESNATSPLMRGGRMVKSHHVVVAELQRQVEEKSGALTVTKSSLENTNSNILKLHAKISALQKFIRELQGSLRTDLSDFKALVAEELCARMAEVSEVVDYINTYVGKVQQAMLSETEAAVSKAKTEFDSVEKLYGKKLEVETQKLSDAENQITYYEDHLRAICLSYEETKHEKELFESELQEKKELIQRMMLEHELEFDAFKNETKETLQEKEMEINQLKQSLSDALSEVKKLQEDKINIDTETKKHQSFVTTQQKRLEEKVKRLEEEKGSVHDLQKAEKQIELAMAEKKHFMQELENANNQLKKQKEEMENQSKSELRELEEKLNTKHSSDLESLRSRFRLAVSLNCMEKSQSPTSSDLQDAESLTCIEDLKKIISENQAKWELERLNAVEEEHKKILDALKESADEASLKHEKEKSQITEALQLQHESALEKLKTRITAENQVSFNEAINSLAKEKDSAIENLRSQISSLEAKQFAVKTYLDRFLPCPLPSETCEHKMSQSELGATSSTRTQNTEKPDIFVSVRKNIEDLLQNTDTTNLAYQRYNSCPDTFESLRKKLKTQEEEYSSLLSKFMSSSTTISGSSCIHCANKVSILTCEVGDVVLVCYEEKLENFIIFHFGSYIHFLHSESLATLDLKIPAGPSEKWSIGIVTQKEFCVTKKVNNRFKLSPGTRFYRVKVVKWSRTAAVALQRSIQNPAVASTSKSQSDESPPQEDGHKRGGGMSSSSI